MKNIYWLIILLVLTNSCEPIQKDPITAILSDGSPLFQKVLQNKDAFEVQIVFTPVSNIKDSTKLESYYFNFRPDDYFYPASSVKMPVAFLALQKLNELRKRGAKIDRNTTLQVDSLRPPQSPVFADSTSSNGQPSISHYIDKLFVVSDNDAYNRLYEFCGQDYINAQLRNKGIFTNSRIIHRVGINGFSFEENKHAPSFKFLDQVGQIVYQTEPTYVQANHVTPVSKTQKGVAYIDSEGNMIEKAFDFSHKNFINIKDLQESLIRIIYPELYAKGETYQMSDEDREFVLSSMATLPHDHVYLQDHLEEYYDGYVKFFLFGDSKEPIPEHITIRNKVGFAYGYLTDCAYIQDTKENIEYFLTATIHVNENKTYNDGVYEYDSIGIPFLAELGRKTHEYMIKNK